MQSFLMSLRLRAFHDRPHLAKIFSILQNFPALTRSSPNWKKNVKGKLLIKYLARLSALRQALHEYKEIISE